MKLIALLTALTAYGQSPLKLEPTDSAHACHVYLVDTKLAQELFEKLAELKPEELKALAPKVEMILGEFLTDVGEERFTQKSFPIPGSSLKATAAVFYTDESMRHAFSMSQAIYAGERVPENARAEIGASTTEVPVTPLTYVVRSRLILKIGGREKVLGLECRTATEQQFLERFQKLR